MPRSLLVLFRERGSTTTILGEEKSSKGDDDLFVILGPSGGGKTTLLRIIAGLVEPDADVIKINGKEMNGVPPFERNTAMAFQNYALYPHMSVYDNIALNMKIRKMKKEEIDKRVKEVASKLHIKDLLTRKPAQLSGWPSTESRIGASHG